MPTLPAIASICTRLPSYSQTPPQVLHRDRILFNVRSGEDIARFLSSPNLEAVLEHGENLRRIALERGYHMGWCWQMLRLRWGGATLADLKLRKADFV